MVEPYCGRYMGYRHTGGAKAYCGEDIGTHIIYCEKCRKRNKNNAKCVNNAKTKLNADKKQTFK